MQKFILTFIFLGVLVHLFYLPVPMEKIQSSLEQETLLHLQKDLKPTPIETSSPAKYVQARHSFLESEIAVAKKNKKKSEVLAPTQNTP